LDSDWPTIRLKPDLHVTERRLSTARGRTSPRWRPRPCTVGDGRRVNSGL
jgi:hypothetical protein